MSTSAVRQVLLGAVVFVAALGVLLGLTAIIRPGRDPGAPAASAAQPVRVDAAGDRCRARPRRRRRPGPRRLGSPERLTAPSGSAATVATLVGAGDIAGCDWDEDEATAALLDGIDGTVFTAGDNVYPAGSTDTYADCFDPTLGPAPGPDPAGTRQPRLGARHARRLLGLLRRRGAQRGRRPVVRLRARQLAGHRPRLGLLARRRLRPGSPQGRWLAETLAASDAACTLAIWHHPRFSSGTHGNDPSVAPFWDALYAAGADVVVNGHEHDYERFAPQDPGGAAGPRARAAPVHRRHRRRRAARLRGPIANSELRLAVGHGVIEFTLGDGGYEWRGGRSRRGRRPRQASCH